MWILKLKVVWLPGRSISLSTENFVCCNRNAILACISYFSWHRYIRVRFVSVNGRESRVKPSKKKFEKKLEENFWKKKFWKINYKRKIFITKIYSNIDKWRSNESVCGIWFKIGSVARSHWTQVMWWFKRSQENSTLRVERRKRGSAQRASSSSHEAEGDRELSSAGRTARGRRPRGVTARDNF